MEQDRDSIALVLALQLQPKALPRFGTPAFTEALQCAFSKSYPSLISDGLKGYEALPEDFPRRTKLAMARLGLKHMGTLELLSEEDIKRRRPSGVQTNLGDTTVERVQALLEDNGKQLRSPSKTYSQAAKTAFGNPGLIPVEWLIFQEAVSLQQCVELRKWGIRCISDITTIPQRVLVLLPMLDTSRVGKIRQVVRSLGLQMR